MGPSSLQIHTLINEMRRVDKSLQAYSHIIKCEIAGENSEASIQYKHCVTEQG